MKKLFSTIIITILTTALGLVMTITWELYFSNKTLTLQKENSIRLIERDSVIEKVEIRIGDERVKNLIKQEYTFENTGYKPVEADDVKQFPRIIFPRNEKILTAGILSKSPENIFVELEHEKESNSLILKFDLLNSGDKVKIAVYFNIDRDPSDPKIQARIKDLKKVEYEGGVIPEEIAENKEAPQTFFWSVIRAYFLFTLFVIAVTIIALSVRDHYWINQTKVFIENHPDYLEAFSNTDELRHFFENRFKFFDASQKEAGSEILDRDKVSFDNRRTELKEFLDKTLSKTQSSTVGIYFGAFIIIICIVWYSSL